MASVASNARVPVRRCDAEARAGRGGVRGLPLLQAGHAQGPDRAHLHDCAEEGERGVNKSKERWRLRALLMCVCGVVQSDTYQEDIYPMTPGTEPALSAGEWLSGIDRGERCGSRVLPVGFVAH